jgi:cupin fold WbuC family metalloprotein
MTLIRVKNTVSPTYYCTDKIIEIDNHDLEVLKNAALADPSKRSRICIHRDHEDSIQEMVIVILKDTKINPHRQLGKEKSYILIEGEMLVTFFNSEGQLFKKIVMDIRSNKFKRIIRFDSSIWHTVVAITDITVYIEITNGPYYPEQTEYANWDINYQIRNKE